MAETTPSKIEPRVHLDQMFNLNSKTLKKPPFLISAEHERVSSRVPFSRQWFPECRVEKWVSSFQREGTENSGQHAMQGTQSSGRLFQIEGFDRPARLVLKYSSLKTEKWKRTGSPEPNETTPYKPWASSSHDPSTGTGDPSPDELIIYKPSDSSLPKSTGRLKAHWKGLDQAHCQVFQLPTWLRKHPKVLRLWSLLKRMAVNSEDRMLSSPTARICSDNS